MTGEPMVYEHVHGAGMARVWDEYIVDGDIVVHMIRRQYPNQAFIGKKVDALPEGASEVGPVSDLPEGDRDVAVDVLHDIRKAR